MDRHAVRIVQVCPYSWSAFGGVQSHVRNLSQHLSRRGHDVLVLAAGPLQRAAAVHQPDAAPAGRADDCPRVLTIGTSTAVPFNGSVAPICVQPRGLHLVRQALLQFQPDIVHVHEPMVPAVSLGAVWFAPVPVVATFHAHCPPSLDRSIYSLAARLLRRTRRRLDVRLAVSRAAAACAASTVRGTVAVVPNGVDIQSFADARPARLGPGRKLLFVNRLDRRKGFDVAVGAFARLCDRYDDLILVVAGHGPCHRDVDAAPPAVRRRILMLGEVDDAELRSLYAAADVFLAPAIGCESFGAVLLEAMAARRPIVASDIDGYREVVRAGVDALVVRARDTEALADGVTHILDDPALAERLASSARVRAQTFGWDVVTDAVEQAYRTAVATPSRRHEGSIRTVAPGSAT